LNNIREPVTDAGRLGAPRGRGGEKKKKKKKERNRGRISQPNVMYGLPFRSMVRIHLRRRGEKRGTKVRGPRFEPLRPAPEFP